MNSTADYRIFYKATPRYRLVDMLNCLQSIARVVLFTSIPFFSNAQEEEVTSYFKSLRSNQVTGVLSFNQKKEGRYIQPLTSYLSDTIASIRSEAYYLLHKLGSQSSQKNIRRNIVHYLLAGIRDQDPGIKNQVEKALTRYSVEDFDQASIDTIKRLLQNLPQLPRTIFKLAGYLELKDQAQLIKSAIELQQPPLDAYDRWAGYLALARMGDQQVLDMILNRIRTFGVNDDVVDQIFPDLAYTRSYRAINYLEEIIYSDKEQCRSANPDSSEKINCAYRVIEILSPLIQDYPIALDVTGSLDTDDYKKALDTIRAWFKERGGTYEVKRDKF